jgi:hypothetical protein
MRVAGIGQAREGPAFEGDERGIGAFGRACRVPCAGQRGHPRGAAAGQQPDHVDLMHRLAEHHAAALGGHQFFRAARAIQEIGVVERLHHAEPAEASALDECAGVQHRRIETVARPDDQVPAAPGGGLDHPRSVRHRDRQRLVDQHVLSGVQGLDRVIGMHLVGRGDIDRLDLRIAHHVRDIGEPAPAELRLESGPAFRARCGRSHQPDAGIGAEARQRQDEGTAQSRDAETKRVRCQAPASPRWRARRRS